MMQDTTIKLRDQLVHYTGVVKEATNFDNLKANGVLVKPHKLNLLKNGKKNARKWRAKLY
ncbi:hypothetical protein CBF34_04580 [Vagococcus penaei]|uniref:Uncharacterized protein n=1 Tax=Vagococcus penaei TaxID=633807 RepID=A0A1Q2D4H5_9ENTE|nr:hypothetical protein [Vagococcus penaei]AQP53304.1 hypothetical protein BW732_03005 [Vagococcus penaei]RSU04074.1 hypothetical protein CBF34_04580 [Vagococcus penaei]